jgi:glycolate oxidase iron-sulfur subunit
LPDTGASSRKIRESNIYCGPAGTYNLIEPEPAVWLGERNTLNVLETGTQLLVTGNAGRLLQIHASLDRMHDQLPFAHPTQILDASICNEPVTTLTR